MEHVIREERRLSFFEKYLTGWVILCIGLGDCAG
jgi:ACR3 family arsenite efflux pump ArsB